MASQSVSYPDEARTRLRVIITNIEREIALLPGQDGPEAGGAQSGLRTAWSALTKELALGPEPEVRACPVCGNFGMRAATLCGYCWTKLTPLV